MLLGICPLMVDWTSIFHHLHRNHGLESVFTLLDVWNDARISMLTSNLDTSAISRYPIAIFCEVAWMHHSQHEDSSTWETISQSQDYGSGSNTWRAPVSWNSSWSQLYVATLQTSFKWEKRELYSLFPTMIGHLIDMTLLYIIKVILLTGLSFSCAVLYI